MSKTISKRALLAALEREPGTSLTVARPGTRATGSLDRILLAAAAAPAPAKADPKVVEALRAAVRAAVDGGSMEAFDAAMAALEAKYGAAAVEAAAGVLNAERRGEPAGASALSARQRLSAHLRVKLSASKPATKPAPARKGLPPSASRVTLSADRPDMQHPAMVRLRRNLESTRRFSASGLESALRGQWARMVNRGELT